MKLNIYKKTGEKASSKVELNDNVFGIEPNKHCVYLTVKSEMAALRQGTSSSKTRGEVSGSGKKPWRQKGTGRARIGSLRNPARVHGAAAFGPKPRSYNVKINRKVRQLARKSVLSDKVASGNLMVLDNLNVETPKTKDFTAILDSLKLSDTKITIMVADMSENLWLSVRNLKNVYIVPATSASTYDMLDCQKLLIDKAGIEIINTQLAN
ncbi:MAG: 50S ribosomal protein L4 [Candidatus Marinimicrobia bacterium]|nr:50S ribosomal protein L4 [Candidatus Neomarinimicrobiota bacterium]MBL7023050.1 50S ribosomal protein L4 [Candidatus Neomarinimicrobiota bacterium]MBL7109070.1 50S ribosomal protein L4 [Candidatus Neomarinimicrobiota bacterium]